MTFRLLVICFCLVTEAHAQIPASRFDKNIVRERAQANSVDLRGDVLSAAFQRLEKNLAEGTVQSFEGFIGPQIFMSISGGEYGYFSSNQAVSLLQSYFVQRSPVSFKFSTVNHRAPLPYAIGRLTYLYRGTRETAQIYIALKQIDSQWVVAQVNIY